MSGTNQFIKPNTFFCVDGHTCGNPVRPEIVELQAPAERLSGRTGQRHLLVVGGSLGATTRPPGRHDRRRPAALKTGTTNDAKDLNAYGYIAPPSRAGRRDGEYALAVGVWAGNSNGSPVTTVSNPVFSLDVAAPLWDAFITDATKNWDVRDFKSQPCRGPLLARP